MRLFGPSRRSLLRQSVHWRRMWPPRRARQADWEGKVAPSPAPGGIGAAVARSLAQQACGWRSGRRIERLDLLADEIGRDGGQAFAAAADLTDEAERQRSSRRPVRWASWRCWSTAGFGWYGFGSDMAWPVAAQMIQTNLAAVAP